MQHGLVIALRAGIFSIAILIGVLFVIFSTSTWLTSGFGASTFLFSIHFLVVIYLWYWGLEKLTNKEKMMKSVDLVEIVRRKKIELLIIGILIGIGFLILSRSNNPPFLFEIFFLPLMALRGPLLYPVEVFVDLRLGIPGVSALLYLISLTIQMVYFYYISRIILGVTKRILGKS
ncbi:MAG: hypothetical protein O6762_03550 [Thaumarchaeota archaeon]|nr:hypothetical protein [Nitrososphaerota archaeon]